MSQRSKTPRREPSERLTNVQNYQKKGYPRPAEEEKTQIEREPRVSMYKATDPTKVVLLADKARSLDVSQLVNI
jgi:hypothetical protein